MDFFSAIVNLAHFKANLERGALSSMYVNDLESARSKIVVGLDTSGKTPNGCSCCQRDDFLRWVEAALPFDRIAMSSIFFPSIPFLGVAQIAVKQLDNSIELGSSGV